MNRLFFSAFAARAFAIGATLVCALISLKLWKWFLTTEINSVIGPAYVLFGYMAYIDLGFRMATNRALLAETDPGARQKLIRFSQTFYSWLSLIIIPAFFVIATLYQFAPNARGFASPLFFWMFGLTGALTLIANIQGNLLVGLGAQSTWNIISGVAALVTTGVMAVALAKGAGVWAFPISATAGFLASFPAAFVIIRRLQPGFKLIDWKIDNDFWTHFHKFKRDAWSSFRAQLSIMFLFTMDTNLISWTAENKQQIGTFCNLARLFDRVRLCLQTVSEVVWPMIAQKTQDTARLTHFLPRFNAWVYGAVMGAACATVSPFIVSYMSRDWSMPIAWVILLAVRFTIVGASSPACYFLIGLGEFKAISRIIERELITAVILGAALGYAFGVNGVLAGFLISTAAGSLFSLFSAYAKAAKKGSAWPLAWEAWWRAALAFVTGLLIALGLIRVLGGGMWLVPIGVIAACVPVALASAPAAARWWRARLGFSVGQQRSRR
jgi:hypothetical protein